MTRPDTKTKILDDGLRYQSKVKGSPFNTGPNYKAAMMSCFLCGTHRIRTSMQNRTLLGKTQAVCAPSCKAAKDADVELAKAALDA